MQGNRGAHSLHAGLQRRGLHVPLRWRAAHGLRFSKQPSREHPCPTQSPKPAERKSQYTLGLARQPFLVRSFQSRSAEEVVLVGRAKGSQKRVFGKAELRLPQTQALRSSAKPNTSGRAGTRCCAARAGGVRLLASSVTQRTMRVGRVHRPLPNPSIERTSPGKPGAASHLKR